MRTMPAQHHSGKSESAMNNEKNVKASWCSGTWIPCTLCTSAPPVRAASLESQALRVPVDTYKVSAPPQRCDPWKSCIYFTSLHMCVCVFIYTLGTDCCQIRKFKTRVVIHTYLSICLSVCLPFYLSIEIYLSIHLSVYLHTYLYAVYIHTYMFLHVCAHLSN